MTFQYFKFFRHNELKLCLGLQILHLLPIFFFHLIFKKIESSLSPGFIVYHKPENVWWLEEKPPVPFADRGGYVWPGHEQLKINMRRYLPQWKAPAFKVQNPFAKLAKDVKD